jgi:hypothetical protein
LAPLTARRAITALSRQIGPHLDSDGNFTESFKDRLTNGPASTRVPKLVKQIRSLRGNWDAMESFLNGANLPRLFRLIAEDTWDKFRESTETHDGVADSRRALALFCDAIAKSRRGNSHSRAKVFREQTDPDNMKVAGWMELVLETIHEASEPSQVALLARKLKARDDLRELLVDGKSELRDPSVMAENLLKNYAPYIRKMKFRSKIDIRRHLGLLARQRRKGQRGAWG